MTRSVYTIPAEQPPVEVIIPQREVSRGMLTYGESAVVEQLARGLSTAHSADNLGITKNTLRVHLNSVYRKIGLTHRGELILWALKHGFGLGGKYSRI